MCKWSKIFMCLLVLSCVGMGNLFADNDPIDWNSPFFRDFNPNADEKHLFETGVISVLTARNAQGQVIARFMDNDQGLVYETYSSRGIEASYGISFNNGEMRIEKYTDVLRGDNGKRRVTVDYSNYEYHIFDKDDHTAKYSIQVKEVNGEQLFLSLSQEQVENIEKIMDGDGNKGTNYVYLDKFGNANAASGGLIAKEDATYIAVISRYHVHSTETGSLGDIWERAKVYFGDISEIIDNLDQGYMDSNNQMISFNDGVITKEEFGASGAGVLGLFIIGDTDDPNDQYLVTGVLMGNSVTETLANKDLAIANGILKKLYIEKEVAVMDSKGTSKRETRWVLNPELTAQDWENALKLGVFENARCLANLQGVGAGNDQIISLEMGFTQNFNNFLNQGLGSSYMATPAGQEIQWELVEKLYEALKSAVDIIQGQINSSETNTAIAGLSDGQKVEFYFWLQAAVEFLNGKSSEELKARLVASDGNPLTFNFNGRDYSFVSSDDAKNTGIAKNFEITVDGTTYSLNFKLLPKVYEGELQGLNICTYTETKTVDSTTGQELYTPDSGGQYMVNAYIMTGASLRDFIPEPEPILVSPLKPLNLSCQISNIVINSLRPKSPITLTLDTNIKGRGQFNADGSFGPSIEYFTPSEPTMNSVTGGVGIGIDPAITGHIISLSLDIAGAQEIATEDLEGYLAQGVDVYIHMEADSYITADGVEHKEGDEGFQKNWVVKVSSYIGRDSARTEDLLATVQPVNSDSEIEYQPQAVTLWGFENPDGIVTYVDVGVGPLGILPLEIAE